MPKALRIVGLAVMAFALVSCGGGVYIGQLILGSVEQRDPLAQQQPAVHDVQSMAVSIALVSLGIFAVGAALFSTGTFLQKDRPPPKIRKTRMISCPACSQPYSAKKLRCPACGEENQIQWSHHRRRRDLLDLLPFLGDLEGPQKAMILTGASILVMLALGAFFLAMVRG